MAFWVATFLPCFSCSAQRAADRRATRRSAHREMVTQRGANSVLTVTNQPRSARHLRDAHRPPCRRCRARV